MYHNITSPHTQKEINLALYYTVVLHTLMQRIHEQEKTKLAPYLQFSSKYIKTAAFPKWWAK